MAKNRVTISEVAKAFDVPEKLVREKLNMDQKGDPHILLINRLEEATLIVNTPGVGRKMIIVPGQEVVFEKVNGFGYYSFDIGRPILPTEKY